MLIYLSCFTGLLLALSFLQVGCVKFWNPPITMPILIRWLKLKRSRTANAPIRQHWVGVEEVSEAFLQCLIVSEDQTFFAHHGFDWNSIKRAIGESRASGLPPRGASTITMQCARSTFLWHKRSWLRKGLEAYYTILMELLLSKKRILELYINLVEFGDGIYGVEAGSRYHFGMAAMQLDRDQATRLTWILPNPRVRRPGMMNKQEHRYRWVYAASEMVALGWLLDRRCQ